MKSAAFLLLFAFMALSSPVTTQAEQEPSYGGGIYHFFRNALSPLYPLTAPNTYDYSGSLNSLHHGFTSLSGRLLHVILKTLEALQRQVARLTGSQSACPPTALPGCRAIGSQCDVVVSTPATFQQALTNCRAGGGTLAQPYPNFTPAFYSVLEQAFPDEFEIIRNSGTEQLWIGYSSATGSLPFLKISTGTPVVPTPPFDPPITTAPGIPQGAVMVGPGTTWKSIPQTALRAYVCAYGCLREF